MVIIVLCLAVFIENNLHFYYIRIYTFIFMFISIILYFYLHLFYSQRQSHRLLFLFGVYLNLWFVVTLYHVYCNFIDGSH